MNAKTSVFVICKEVIIYLLIYNLQDCTFNRSSCLTDLKESIQNTKTTLILIDFKVQYRFHSCLS